MTFTDSARGPTIPMAILMTLRHLCAVLERYWGCNGAFDIRCPPPPPPSPPNLVLLDETNPRTPDSV